MPTSPTSEVMADLRAYQRRKREAQNITRISQDNAPCKFDGLSEVDLNNACLRCGAVEGEDCRDI